jgi:hypothetical protein
MRRAAVRELALSFSLFFSDPLRTGVSIFVSRFVFLFILVLYFIFHKNSPNLNLNNKPYFKNNPAILN